MKNKTHHLPCNPMPQLSAPPYWTLLQAVPSPTPSSQTRFPQRAKGLRPLLQRPSSPGTLRFPLPGILPLLPKVKVPDPMKNTQTTAPALSLEPLGSTLDAISSFPKHSSPLFPPLTPTLATPPSSDSQSLLVTPTGTPPPTPPEYSSPRTLNPSLSPLPTTLYEALTPLPQLCPSTTWDYYIRTQGMRIPCPLYHEAKIKKGRKTTKKLKKYRLTPEEFREQETCALVEMPTSGYMLTRQVLGKLLASQRPPKVTN